MQTEFEKEIKAWSDEYLHQKFWEGTFWVVENETHVKWGEMNKKLDLIRRELHERWDRGWTKEEESSRDAFPF